jgi:hypothetical protein
VGRGYTWDDADLMGGREEESAALWWLDSMVHGRATGGAGQRWWPMALLLGWRNGMTVAMG